MSSATSSPTPSPQISLRRRFAACCSSAQAVSRPERSIEERLALRAPRFNRAVAGFIALLPPSSRLRRRAVSRIIRNSYSAVERGDLDALLSRYSAAIRYHAPPEHVAMGDFDAVYRGHDGVRKYLGAWIATWQEMRFDLSEIVDDGDTIMVLEEFYGRPHGTSAELKQRQGRVMRLQRGMVVEEHWLMSWDETRRLAGLPEG